MDVEAVILLCLKDLMPIFSVLSIVALFNYRFKFSCEVSVAASALRVKRLRLEIDAVLHGVVFVEGAPFLLRSCRSKREVGSRGRQSPSVLVSCLRGASSWLASEDALVPELNLEQGKLPLDLLWCYRLPEVELVDTIPLGEVAQVSLVAYCLGRHRGHSRLLHVDVQDIDESLRVYRSLCGLCHMRSSYLGYPRESGHHYTRVGLRCI